MCPDSREIMDNICTGPQIIIEPNGTFSFIYTTANVEDLHRDIVQQDGHRMDGGRLETPLCALKN